MSQDLEKVKEPLLFFCKLTHTLKSLVYLQVYFKYILNQLHNHSLLTYYDEKNINLDISEGITTYFKYQIHHELTAYNILTGVKQLVGNL